MPSFTLRTDIDQRLPLFSTIGAGGEVFRTTQLALLAASQEAGVTRFAPSEFTVLKYEGLDLCAPKVPVQDAVKASGLEYTLFSRGIFMNGFAAGIPKGEEEALALLRPWNFVVNIQAGTADVPGMGEETVTFTEIGDVCRFVAAALELENVVRRDGDGGGDCDLEGGGTEDREGDGSEDARQDQLGRGYAEDG